MLCPPSLATAAGTAGCPCGPHGRPGSLPWSARRPGWRRLCRTSARSAESRDPASVPHRFQDRRQEAARAHRVHPGVFETVVPNRLLGRPATAARDASDHAGRHPAANGHPWRRRICRAFLDASSSGRTGRPLPASARRPDASVRTNGEIRFAHGPTDTTIRGHPADHPVPWASAPGPESPCPAHRIAPIPGRDRRPSPGPSRHSQKKRGLHLRQSVISILPS